MEREYCIPLARPYLPPGTEERVTAVLRSGYLTEGGVTREFEETVAAYIGCKYAVAATSCTTGLELAIRALGIGPGDEVIVPDYTYPATASAVAITGATPVLVDIDPTTTLIDYNAVEAAITRRAKAVMPVSQFGFPLDYDRLEDICRTHGLAFIEDAACALGATYKNRRVGTQADITVFSFHPRKAVTTGEGGVVVTDSRQWADWMQSYKHFGMAQTAERDVTVFERVGTNYKLSNVLAALGLAQFSIIEELLARRRHMAMRYRRRLSAAGIQVPAITPRGNPSWQTCCVLIEHQPEVRRRLRAKGIEVQVGTYSLHLHPAFADKTTCRKPGDFPGSDYAFDHVLALPLYHEMTEADQDIVIAELLDTLQDLAG